ncbi:MAG: hypothetical protein QOJ65_183 [Fimbriimonadaceae bacterium]|nr:hypothetical protein [Fimbriimonadaceae bacterium]
MVAALEGAGLDGLAEWEEEAAKPPPRRIKDAKSAHALYRDAREADKENAYNRKVVNEMIDGDPPYDDQELDTLGHGDAVNLNFLEGTAVVESALSSYNDLTSSVDILWTCHTKYGDKAQRPELGRIISEEWTRINKEWSRFEFNVQHLADKFVKHGVGVAYFDNDVDWRWKTSGLGDFHLPRDTEACEEELEYAIATRSYTVSKLYQFIEDPEAAKANGWNADMVKQAIWNAYKGGLSSSPSLSDWEEFQVQIKNNDLFYGYAKAPKVKVNHLYVREFSGTYSHYMLDEKGELDDFMFKREDRFKEIGDCLVLFTYGIGNGYYHGIRGLGYKIFPQIQTSNRLRCRLVEGGMLGSSLLIQPSSAEDLENLNLVYYGPYAVLPPNMKTIERVVPNFAQNVMPIIQDLSRQIQNNTGSYAARAVTPESNTERTKFEVQAQLQQESTLSTAAMNLFYLPWKRLGTASFRRAQNRDYRQDDPGGCQVFEFRRRCVERGVPMEAIYKVDKIEPVRAIGYGSPGNRLLALNEIEAMAPQFDPVGRRNALRDRVAVRVGYEQAERYVPSIEGNQRPPIDAKIAELENASLRQGQLVSVQPGEMDDVHLGIHMGDMTHVITLVSQGQSDPKEALTYFQQAFPHCAAHVKQLAVDPLNKSKVNDIEHGLTILGEQAQQIQKALIEDMKAQAQAMQEQAMQQQGANGQIDPELQRKMEAHALAMKLLEDASQVKMGIKEKEANQRMMLKDVTTSRKLQQDHAQSKQDQAQAAEQAAREAEQLVAEKRATGGAT